MKMHGNKTHNKNKDKFKSPLINTKTEDKDYETSLSLFPISEQKTQLEIQILSLEHHIKK